MTTEENNEQFQIWAPYQVLYIESLFTVTSTAVNYIKSFTLIHDEIYYGNFQSRNRLIDSLQNIVIQAAVLSKYFWPIRDKNSYTKNRGIFLRSSFEIREGNPLKDRKIRDAIEHFDERLDKFTSQGVIGTILPEYIGEKTKDNGIPVSVFRAYYIDEQTFEILGEKFQIIAIIKEIYRIHEMVLEYRESGTFRRNYD